MDTSSYQNMESTILSKFHPESLSPTISSLILMSKLDNPTVCTLSLDKESASKSNKWDHFTMRRLVLDEKTSIFVGNIFESATERYTEDVIDYTPDYNPDPDQTFVIRDFPFPTVMMKGLSNSAVLEAQEHVDDDIKALVVSNKECTSIAFQIIDKGHRLEKKPCLILDNKTFKQNKEAGIILRESLSCLYEDGNLYFKSYRYANMIFDLNQYLELASDEAIQVFMSCPFVKFEDSDYFKKHLNQTMRRNITLIHKAGILDFEVDEVRKVIEDNHLPVQLEDDMITIPKDKDGLRNVMSFFTEKMFITLFSKRVCVSNSILPISEPGIQ